MTNSLISIDIFDTVITRDVYKPTDIFKLIEREIGNDFYRKRIKAENLAREENTNYNISDIYKYLPEFDVQKEIDTEIAHCKNIKSVPSFYNPQNCVFVSDMYLPSNILATILENAGYKNPKIYVSCEHGKNKSTGELFKLVEKIERKKIAVHFGDNYNADVLGAQLAGIKTIFTPALHNIDYNLPKVKNPMLKKYLALACKEEPLKKLALWYAPVIYEFTKWVLSKREEGQKIFFLSRDMFMPYQIAKNVFKANDVYYLHASRKSIAGLCLKSKNKELARKMSFIFTDDEIEKRTKQDDSEVLKYLKQFDIKNDDIIADIGYAGTIQAGINYALNIKTKGLYLQVSSNVLPNLKTEMFLNRMAIHFCLLVEFIFGSYEDCIEGYKDGKPIFTPDNPFRKRLANQITTTILNNIQKVKDFNTSIFDIEQILIHTQYWADDEIVEVYNQKIFSNRDKAESIINYDESEIRCGNLLEMYQKSYCQPLFKQLLEKNKDLKHLAKLLS